MIHFPDYHRVPRISRARSISSDVPSECERGICATMPRNSRRSKSLLRMRPNEVEEHPAPPNLLGLLLDRMKLLCHFGAASSLVLTVTWTRVKAVLNGEEMANVARLRGSDDHGYAPLFFLSRTMNGDSQIAQCFMF